MLKIVKIILENTWFVKLLPLSPSYVAPTFIRLKSIQNFLFYSKLKQNFPCTLTHRFSILHAIVLVWFWNISKYLLLISIYVSSSPLGFSELFNEFRLHENLHSLDDILYAIIDADGMSFNDLKPIYKEFLLKLAVTLTKDELFQRSKNIMRRQKKKKLKRKIYSNGSQVSEGLFERKSHFEMYLSCLP